MMRRIVMGGLMMAAVCVMASAGRADDFAETSAQNWPAWRGPHADGVAPQGSPPLTWSETENVKWKVEIPGRGSSTPIIWEDRIYLLTAEATGEVVEAAEAPEPAQQGRRGRRGIGRAAPSQIMSFDVLALDRASGKTIWRSSARKELPHEGHHPDHGYASFSPVTDGEALYINYGSHGVHAFDLDGNRLWERDFGKMKTRRGFGEGSSPALHGDRLVVVFDHDLQSFVEVLDKKTGETLWRRDRKEMTTWATPLIVTPAGRAQAVLSGTARVQSYDLDSGEVIWEDTGQTLNTIPSPVSGHGMVFVTSGFRGAALHAIELGNTGDLTDTDAIRWTVSKATPYVPSPLLYNENIYVYSGNRAILSSYKAQSGEPNFIAQRVDGLGDVYASPVGASGRVYLVGRDGSTVVIDNSSELKILATNQLDDGFDASPAIVGGELFLRGQKNLYSIAAQ